MSGYACKWLAQRPPSNIDAFRLTFQPQSRNIQIMSNFSGVEQMPLCTEYRIANVEGLHQSLLPRYRRRFEIRVVHFRFVHLSFCILWRYPLMEFFEVLLLCEPNRLKQLKLVGWDDVPLSPSCLEVFDFLCHHISLPVLWTREHVVALQFSYLPFVCQAEVPGKLF